MATAGTGAHFEPHPSSEQEERRFSLGSSIRAHKWEFCWAALRLVLGFLMVVKGAYYLKDLPALTAVMRDASVPFASPELARFVAVVHLGGGLMLAFGIFTRFAALIQIPNVIGAIVFMQARELFTAGDSVEFPVLVLTMLVMHVILGSGRWSTEGPFRKSLEAPKAAGAA